MTDRPAQDPDGIDAKTGKAVAEAIGERLRADARREEPELPGRLRILLEQLRAQEDAVEDTSPATRPFPA
jgi:hypothetical protein